MIYRAICGFTLIGISLLTFGAPAQATTFTFAYEGVINSIFGSTGSIGATMATFNGKTLRFEYSFNSTDMGNPDTASNPNLGIYSFTSFTATLEGNVYTDTTGGPLRVFNDAGADSYDVQAVAPSLSGPLIAGPLHIGSGLLQAQDLSESVFTNDGLPTTPIDPTKFDLFFIQLRFVDLANGGFGVVRAENNVTLTSVPIPSTLLLFGFSFAGFAAWRRRAEKIDKD